MMIQFRNERGRGVCLNNKGNALKQMGNRLDEALNMYNLAIQNAESLANLEKDPSRKAAYEIVLANRLMNLGVLYKEFEPQSGANQANAEQHLQRSLDLHRKNDSVEGIAQVSGNLGQLYLDTGRSAEAAGLITDAYETVKERGNHISIQYAAMNMGILADRSGKPEEAVSWYTYVLQRYDTIVAYVQLFCVKEVIRICESPSVNRPAFAASVREVGVPLFGHAFDTSSTTMVKDVAFVLDCSGSMTGAYIRACRQSLTDIITKYTFPGDRLSLTTFQHKMQVVWSLQPRDETMMVNLVQTKTSTNGATAFWDALLHAIQTLKSASSASSSKPAFGSPRALWVVALTDGYDNSSNPTARNNVQAELRSSGHISLLAITVGNLENEAEIIQACQASRNGGLHIKAQTNADAIKEAFSKAARVMVGDLKVESL
ncbi:hypothetical protein BC938DRAFT_471466 [Jimgerdemannia flammicorona]|uniref:VWFA domain-containing protein n=1 Tax=Jimgerdemannia flammicorona TaxID=994334 RepID=A0A433QUK7_9FUNG|nr:hypothetical protein BC938DRAFT_471466 [Jimgerdemannia flammicorona]